ncbi:MAG: alpha-mannosidase [Armatimonadetes bacterium]|nr:alpha-mannosidase [Armatimonadota bacterium]
MTSRAAGEQGGGLSSQAHSSAQPGPQVCALAHNREVLTAALLVPGAAEGPRRIRRIRSTVKHRIRWTAEKFEARLKLIEPLVYRRTEPLPPFRYLELSGPESDPPCAPEVDDQDWPVLQPDEFWGPPQTDFVLRTTFTVPESWDLGSPLALHLPLGGLGDFSHPEALVHVDGLPYQACDRHHQEVVLPPWCRDGRPHSLALHGWTGLGGNWERVDPGARLRMRPCYLVEICEYTRALATRTRVALGLARTLPEDDPARDRLLNALQEVFARVDTREPLDPRFYRDVEPAAQQLHEALRASGAPLDVELIAAGHAHIDVGWLWAVTQSRRKAGRTFHTVCRLMEQFPEFTFTQSQPQLYEYVRQDYPALFETIGRRVVSGQWEPIGGMWVEADVNLTGAEALVRQLVLGRSFFREHFGAAESPVLWLPDVFGYCWSLPQLIKGAGLDYFFTIKIGWSQYNRMPCDSFWWQGLDGTRVLTHFSTAPDLRGVHASTYNAVVTPEQVVGTWRKLQHKESQNVLLVAYGHGDGGGGPTREMIEGLREMASAPSCPRARCGKAHEFFLRLENRSGADLPVWNGELYLEYHRGTYTTQARIKRGNRRCESLLHTVEFLVGAASLLDPDYTIPRDSLTDLWRRLCLNQFHDILPGSSIRRVNQDAEQDHDFIEQCSRKILAGAAERVGRALGGDLLLMNPTSFVQSGLVRLEEAAEVRDAEGRKLAVQACADGGVFIAAESLPPYGLVPLRLEPAGKLPGPGGELSVSANRLENRWLVVDLDDHGELVRIFDKEAGREVLPPGARANQLQLFEDRPMQWDAWDIDIYYDDKMWTPDPADKVAVIEEGPLLGTVEVRRRLMSSPMIQRISLSRDSRRLDFETAVDWRERHMMLKVAFPVDILAPNATFDIQWGCVERPTHRNTSWDWARFESCAHKWVDLSEGNYGVSLLNDCKYGHDVHENVLRLTLLRSPTVPDPEADQGEHRFTYSLLPHPGRWGEETLREAYRLNFPLAVLPCRSQESPRSVGLVRVDASHVVVETVKPAEVGQGIVVRLYETMRMRGRIRVETGFSFREAWRTDLLENRLEKLPAEGSAVEFSIRPFEIVTLRFETGSLLP